MHAMIGMTQSGMMGGGTASGMMGGGMLLGWIAPLLILAGLGALVVWTVRKLSGDREVSHRENDALATARRRYARGEIDREEFHTLRSDLTSG
jgi:uncharacterized membrane protein